MSRVSSRFLVVAMATLLATGWLSAAARPALAAGSISLAAMNTAYTQDFNTLNTVGTANALTINGWDLTETGGGARDNEAYGVDTGGSGTGDTYSYGTLAAPLDRALGALRSGSLVPVYGTSFTNNTGATIGKLDVSYTGEMYRAGVVNRNAADQIDFQLSTTATGLTSPTWTDYNSLDFATPDINDPVGAKDGNAAAYRTLVSFQITGLSIANGSTFWIRWTDANPPDADDGLAIDDFSLTPRVANDPAPSVTATTPADGAENVAADANIGITFSEAVTVADPWFDITCDSTGAHTASVSGGPTVFSLNPDADFADLEICTVTVDDAAVTDVDSDDPPNNMAADFVFDFQVGPECDDTYTPIYDIQGSGPSAAITGPVQIEGVVVGDFEGIAAASGFYVQDPLGDGDPATSDGIFVFTGTGNLASVGDYVHVNGFARERFNQTTINASNSDTAAVTRVFPCGTDSVAATEVNLPFASAGFPERYEGMSVTFPQALVISEYFNYGQFGEMVLALPLNGEKRPFTGTAIDEPGPDANARNLANSLSRITLDDANSARNPEFLRHPDGTQFTLDNLFRGGDKVQNATGVLGYDFNLYRIIPTEGADHTEANPRTAEPDDVDGDLIVAAMNTLNFFITGDDSGGAGDNVCGGNGNLECRGWDSNQPLEFDRQRDKLLQALAGINADVLGLNEIENGPADPLGHPTRGIVAGLNDLLGAGTYDFIDTGLIGTDAIRVGLIFKPASVTPVGDFETLDSDDDPRFIDTRSRPALAQTFMENSTGELFTVVVNHLKSKGSACAGDPDLGDGQGNCSQTRSDAAEALVDWLAADPTGSGDPDFLIAGDLNSYAKEDAIDEILEGADDLADSGDEWTNLINAYLGAYAYSYVFDGMSGYLDHALANATLTGQVTGATEWHINADEPSVLDYDTSFKPAAVDALWALDAYRTSDHDPVLVGLDLNAPPIFTIVRGVSCMTAAVGGSFLVSVDDLQVAPGDLSLTLSGNTNTTLVPNANVVISGGADRTIAIQVANKKTGSGVLTFTLSDGVNDVTFDINVQIGTDLNDTLTGTSGADLIAGNQGDDTLSGLGGADALCGGNGDDVLTGGDGNDALAGEKGNDTLSGGAGDDTLSGGFGIDVLNGDAGDDSLFGNEGNDSLTGGTEADAFSGGSGADTNTDFGDGDTSDGT